MPLGLFNFQRIRYVNATGLVVSTSAYSANDAVGPKISFAGSVLNNQGASFLLGVRFFDDVQVKAALKLFLFREDPGSLAADNAAFALTDAQAKLLLPGGDPIASSTYDASISTSAWYTSILSTPVPVKLNKGKTLYGQLMCTGTPTFASTGALKVELVIGQVGGQS